jgi:hypothetical protein
VHVCGSTPASASASAIAAGLAVDARRQVADLARAVVVDRRTEDDRVMWSPSASASLEAAQHDDAGARCRTRCPRCRSSNARQAVRRQDLASAERVAAILRHQDRDAAGQAMSHSPASRL